MRSRRVYDVGRAPRSPGGNRRRLSAAAPAAGILVVRLWRSVPRPPGRSSVGGCEPPPRAPPRAPPPGPPPGPTWWWRAATDCSTRSAPAGWVRCGARTTCAPGRTSRSRCSGATARRCWPGSCASRPSGCGTRTWWRRTAGPRRTTSSCSPWSSWPAGRWPTCCASTARSTPAPAPCWSSSCCWAWRPSTGPGSCTATSSPPTSSSRRRATGRPTCASATSGWPPRSPTAASPRCPARSAPTATWRPSRRGVHRRSRPRTSTRWVGWRSSSSPVSRPLARASSPRTRCARSSSGCWSPTPSSASRRPRRRCDCSVGCRSRRQRGHRCPTGWDRPRVDGVRRRGRDRPSTGSAGPRSQAWPAWSSGVCGCS